MSKQSDVVARMLSTLIIGMLCLPGGIWGAYLASTYEGKFFDICIAFLSNWEHVAQHYLTDEHFLFNAHVFGIPFLGRALRFTILIFIVALISEAIQFVSVVISAKNYGVSVAELYKEVSKL